MLPRFLDRLTPRVFPRTRLLTAALVWTSVGAFLCAKGIWLSMDAPKMPVAAATVAGLCLGVLKSWLVFDRVAGKIIGHIGRKQRPSCLGGLFSVRNWALILIMAVFGRILGALPIHAALKTVIYVLVGSGLGYSSRLLWAAWKNSPADVL